MFILNNDLCLGVGSNTIPVILLSSWIQPLSFAFVVVKFMISSGIY